ncbi:MAG: VWA domain-containing protein [Alphaproteobacteria bacterium]|nr:VWA domain-containing protein [Alphaproteobacteria bacterium]
MSTPWHVRTEGVCRHPAVVGLGRDEVEQLRVEAFARDLAAWLDGAPRSSLAPLGRVVTAVGGRGLRDARTVCRDLPLLAVEAAARATATLWPLLALPPEEEPPPAGAAEDGDGGEAQESEAEEGADDEDGDEGAPEADGDPHEDDADPEDAGRALLQALADGAPPDDPELDALARQLAVVEGPEHALADRLEPVGGEAWEGAREGEELARTLEQLVPGVGWGMAPGHLHAALGARLERAVALLHQLPELRALAERLGRLEADEATTRQEEGGGEEVTGVRLGGEAAAALPAELALLGDPDTEDLFYQRLLEHRLLSLELSGSGVDGVQAPQVRGPVLACIDTSGSMAGPPEQVAKAMVLAVCRRVLPQGRTVHLLLFGATGEGTELRLRRGRSGLEDLLDFLALRFEGGTDFDTPLRRALELLQERELERADVLVVTDGLGHARTEVVQAVAEARAQRGVRVLGVVVGEGDEDAVRAFSDEVWRIDPLAVEGGGTLLRRVSAR